jgi:hypothetical protein
MRGRLFFQLDPMLQQFAVQILGALGNIVPAREILYHAFSLNLSSSRGRTERLLGHPESGPQAPPSGRGRIGVNSRASVTFSSSCAMLSQPMITVETGSTY